MPLTMSLAASILVNMSTTRIRELCCKVNKNEDLSASCAVEEGQSKTIYRVYKHAIILSVLLI